MRRVRKRGGIDGSAVAPHFPATRNESIMSIEIAEKLKAQLTDKYVVVKHGVAELKRFESLTGVVKTVNMAGRALVQFDGPVDISWYDIDPQYLSVVKAPAKAAESGAPAASGAKLSPLELARQQGALKPSGAAAAKPAAPAKAQS